MSRRTPPQTRHLMRSSRPAATACTTAVAVNSFEIDWTLKIVSAFTGAEPPRSTSPKPSTHKVRSSSTRATASPGIPCSAIRSGMRARYLAITVAAASFSPARCVPSSGAVEPAPTPAAATRPTTSHQPTDAADDPDAASDAHALTRANLRPDNLFARALRHRRIHGSGVRVLPKVPDRPVLRERRSCHTGGRGFRPAGAETVGVRATGTSLRRVDATSRGVRPSPRRLAVRRSRCVRQSRRARRGSVLSAPR
jgi:hypothetical protein